MANLKVHIDTITACIADGGFFLKDVSKAVVYNSKGRMVTENDNRLVLPGKDGIHNIHVRSLSRGKFLQAEGSPFAHKYGQNMFTCSDMHAAVQHMFDTIFTSDIFLNNMAYRGAVNPYEVMLQRADLAVNLIMDDARMLQELIKMLKAYFGFSGKNYHGYENGAVLFVGGRDELVIRWYHKGMEIKKSRRAAKHTHYYRLAAEYDNVLRIEIQIRKRKLRELGLVNAGQWNLNSANDVFREIMRGLDFPTLVGSPRNVTVDSLDDHLKPAFGLYTAGLDVRQYFNEKTYQLRRNEFREKFDLNLDMPYRDVHALDGPTLKAMLSPSNSCPTPSWLIRQGFCPPSN